MEHSKAVGMGPLMVDQMVRKLAVSWVAWTVERKVVPRAVLMDHQWASKKVHQKALLSVEK